MTTSAHSVQPGEFFVCSWGYDQTNVDYYKVIAVTPKSVRIQLWANKVQDGRVVPGDKPATRVTRVLGEQVEHDATVRIKRVQRISWNGETALTMNSYSNAYLWDGRPAYDTRAAGEAGH